LFDPKKFLESCPAELRQNVVQMRPLREMTTLQVGGPAALVCSIQTSDQARQFQDICSEVQAPVFFLGSGSNVLAADQGFAGVIFHLSPTSFTIDSDTVTVGAGVDFDTLIHQTLQEGLTGLEFASGIPGTLGGALVGNAGCYGHEIGEFLDEAQILRSDGTIQRAGPEDFGFSYRSTAIRERGDLVLEATLRLSRADVAKATQVRQEKLAERKAKHPVDLACAGSWFRNLPPESPGDRRRPAGHYLELAGAKEMSEGNAKVFPGHANMIINTGGATSEQISTLADRMRKAVLDKFGLELIEEVRRIPQLPVI